MPAEYVKAVAQYGIVDGGGVAFPAWTSESQIALMVRNGIANAVMSVSAPGVHFGDDAAARGLARRVNEFAARLISDQPRRLGAFATLTLPDVDGALDELAYALDVLKLDGVILLASIGELYLGDPAFEELYAELNRRNAVVFIHPTVPVTSQTLKMSIPGAVVEFVFDTTRAVANLIYSGTLEKYPDIRFIVSHAGGTIPFVAGRLAQGRFIPKLQDKAPQGAIAYLQRLYYDTAISATPYQLTSLRELVDASHILFGSDTPFLPEPAIGAQILGLEAYRGFSAADRRVIERDAALALFPRFSETATSTVIEGAAS
jgi:predicted TIM-barrel fold metal-dependent hydrolase